MERHCEEDRRAEAARGWSDISDQLARDHVALQEQHELVMRRWEDVKRRVDCDREQSEKRSRQLKKKEAEIEALKSQKGSAESHAIDLQRQVEAVQKEHSQCGKVARRKRNQRNRQFMEHNQQLALRKEEFCNLERELDEVNAEKETLRHHLNEEKAQSAAYLAEIRVLKDKISQLESENNKLHEQLDTSLSEQRESSAVQASQIADAENKLAASDETLKTIQLQMQKSCRLRQHSDSLRRLESNPTKFCDPTHLDFQYLTDCGTLLCVDCSPAVSDAQADGIFTTAMGLRFEGYQCPWCFAERWAWQRLEVPCSLAWVLELKALQDVVFGSST